MSFGRLMAELDRAQKVARMDADYVMRWLLQADAPWNVIELQARVLKEFGWPTHGRHCTCSACAREDWTGITAPCGMHGEHCPASYQPYKARPGQATWNGVTPADAERLPAPASTRQPRPESSRFPGAPDGDKKPWPQDPIAAQRELLANPERLPALLADVLIAIALVRDDHPTPHAVARDLPFGWTEDAWRSNVEPHLREQLNLPALAEGECSPMRCEGQPESRASGSAGEDS